MTVGVHDQVIAAREALARHDWRDAFEKYRSADAEGLLDADALREYGQAAWWAAEIETCIEARTRAFTLLSQAGRTAEAAEVAIEQARVHFNRGQASAGSGWLSQATRMLEGTAESGAHVYLECTLSVRAQYTGSIEEAVERGRRAFEIAERVGDPTRLAMALNRYGAALVYAGEVEKGLRYIDESMVAAVTGDLDPFVTGVIYCSTISACHEMADYRRAGEWTDAARRWCERQSISGFPGVCRVMRADVMRLRGAWNEAETEARRALEELVAHGVPSMAAAGAYAIGEIRLRMGDLAGAEQAFEQAHELGAEPQPGLAVLRMTQGRVDAAAGAINAALKGPTADRLHRARLLPTQAQIAVRSGDLETARAASEELDGIAEAYGSQALLASAAETRAAVRLLEGDVETALVEARRAWMQWQEVEAPYEAARARVLLAEIHERAGDRDAAMLQLRAARAAFEELGAVPDARAAAASLGTLEPAAGDAAGSREVRTFMFTDIVQSTNLLEVLGDEAWGDLLRWHDATLRTLFVEHRGEEIDHAGDGFFVAFPDEERAIRCAVAIQRRLTEQRRDHGFAPQVRIGLHAAEAVREASNYHGRGVHAAARIGALAGGGEIVASVETVRAVPEAPPASDARAVTLKGLSEPVEVVTLDWRAV